MATLLNTSSVRRDASGGYAKGGRASSGNGRGFTLVEVLIAILITAVVAGAIYSLYNTFFRQATVRDIVTEAQQNARVAVSTVERELMNAGYAAGTGDIITEANASSMEFIYTDPETNPLLTTTPGKRLKVRYALQTTGGVQYLTRKADNLSDATTGSTEMVIPYVNNITFTYYDINGSAVASTVTQADRNNIKFVTINLVTETKSDVPGTTQKKTFMLETHVRLRNIGVGTTATDTTAPSSVTAVLVRDPGLCGRLKVKWNMNTEGDIAGYKVYYGTSSGSYTGVINIPLTVLSGSTYSCSAVSSTYECTIFPSNPALQYTASNALAGSETVYYIALKAYDNSLNHSNFSTEVNGNPDPSSASFGAGSNDSTINPVKPVVVTGFRGADGAADQQVALSWDPYNTSANPDVVGYRIYRSTSAFASYPVTASASIEWIAGEPGSGKPEVSVSATSYTDVGPGLLGCRVYYYAIAPVNCDTSLLPDDGGDPDAKKYLQTDYAATCGDGSNPCTPGSGFSASSTSDTAPAKTTPPGAPTLNARAAWKRVALSLTQPSDADLSQTCIYSNQGATLPALDTVSAKILGCYQVDVSTPDAIRLYEDGGIFTVAELARSQSTTFWHNSMTSLTSTPSLLETGTYSYRAISFDLCGNSSSMAEAFATTTLCGEDPVGKPDFDASKTVTASYCSTPVSLTWDEIPSDLSQASTNFNPYDLAGYRIFRSTSNADWSGATLLNTSAPFWGSTYSDATVAEGSTYYYRIVPTDCPYEKVSPDEATIRGDMIGATLDNIQTVAVYPGRLVRDEKCTGAGACTKDLHREVLTGVNLSATNAPSPDSNYTHDKVTFFFENTSFAKVRILAATVEWVNSSAKLREIKFGGGRSGVTSKSVSISAAQTTSVSGTPPYTSAVLNYDLSSSDMLIDKGASRYIPFTFEFKDAAGDRVDMRDDQLLITLSYRIEETIAENGIISCPTYMTVSEGTEGVVVPFGPSLTATQQNRPTSPTFSYAVPGPTGLNTVPNGSDGPIAVDGGAIVKVSTVVTSNTTHAVTGSKVAISSATLYYVATAKTVTTAPASGYTSAAMTSSGGGVYSYSIPAQDGMRVWYYIVVVDEDGNFDRDPEVSHGAYVYDQKVFDKCQVNPSAVTDLAATQPSVGSTTINLAWSAPTTYTSGATIDTSTDPLKYDVFRTDTTGATVTAASNLTVTAFTDSAANGVVSNKVYIYTVKAKNSCASPGPRESSDSNKAGACTGASATQAALTVSPSSIYQGGSFTVTVVDCFGIDPTHVTNLDELNVTAGFNTCPTTAYATTPTCFSTKSTAPLTGSINPYNPGVSETAVDSALFTRTITTTGNTADTDKLLTLTTDTITVYYYYASPQTVPVSVIVDPCTNTPSAPGWFGGFPNMSGSGSNRAVNLKWTTVTTNTDGSSIADLAGYRIYERVCAKNKPDCTGADVVQDWFVRTTTTADNVSLTADNGLYNQRIYYFKVVAYDTCSTPLESSPTTTWAETD